MNAVCQKQLFALLAFVILFVIPHKAQSQYVPLSTDSLKRYWSNHPDANVQDYIHDVVELRKVGFLPNKMVRVMLRNAGVPENVIRSLKANVHSHHEFRFVVCKFTSPSLQFADQIKDDLAASIISEYNDRQSRFTDVFPAHAKPPYAYSARGECPQPSDPGGRPNPPLMHLTGKVERDDRHPKVTIQLQYTNDVEPKPLLVGKEGEITGIILDNRGLKAASKSIVDKVHEILREEFIE